MVVKEGGKASGRVRMSAEVFYTKIYKYSHSGRQLFAAGVVQKHLPTLRHAGGQHGFEQPRAQRGQRQRQGQLRDADAVNAGLQQTAKVVASESARQVKMARQRLRIYYSGRVQGVGFRFTVKQLARGFEVIGTVRNLLDGRVELQAEGEKAELEEFRKAIQDSELGSLIRQEEAGVSEARNEFRGFDIVR